MAKKQDPSDETDPVVVAALIDDDEDEDKKPSEDSSKKTPEDGKDTDKPSDKKEGDDVEEEETPKPDEPEKEEDDDKKPEPKPKEPEAEDKKPSSDEERQTRKEKREERKQRWLESVRKDREARSQRPPQAPPQDDYKPLDYSQADQFAEEDLEKDRQTFGARKYVEGQQAAAARERFVADQERFWDSVDYEARILEHDPKFAFLKEDGPEFDEERASEVNDMYLEFVGFEQKPAIDPQTRQPKLDQNGQPIMLGTVQRTDISYEKFVKRYVENMENWADEQVAETSKNLASQKSTQGIRPSGSSKKGLGKLRPGDISKMSDEDFDKNEEEIDRQIMEML